jgi:hypothetical protein
MKQLVACGAAALLVFAAGLASAQKDKDKDKDKPPPKDKDKGAAKDKPPPKDKDKEPKDKDKDKQPPKDKDKTPRAEPKAVVALRALGAVLDRDQSQNFVGVNLFGAKAGDADLALVAELKTVVTLDLSGVPISDAGLAHLKGLSLQALDLRNTRVSDAGLAHLAGMKTLTYLNLAGTGVSANLSPASAPSPRSRRSACTARRSATPA